MIFRFINHFHFLKRIAVVLEFINLRNGVKCDLIMLLSPLTGIIDGSAGSLFKIAFVWLYNSFAASLPRTQLGK